jgi:hypothetical protein
MPSPHIRASCQPGASPALSGSTIGPARSCGAAYRSDGAPTDSIAKRNDRNGAGDPKPDASCTTLGRPLVSPGFAGCHGAGPIGASARASPAARRRTSSQKGPAIGDGSQSREKRQRKSIRGRAMCRNSHTKRETLAHEAFRNRATRHEARRLGIRVVPVKPGAGQGPCTCSRAAVLHRLSTGQRQQTVNEA